MAALMALASCAPQAFVVRSEMRGPSKSGLSLAGKSMAVVYLTDGNPRDTLFNASAAGGFASRLEEEYFGGKREIELDGSFESMAITSSSSESQLKEIYKGDYKSKISVPGNSILTVCAK